jgi:DNA polymerase-4
MKRIIFHLDLDAFFASVEQLRHPRLRGKPIVVGGGPGTRGVVASASYEARRYGVRSAMPLSRVKRFCPHCVFLPCRFDDYEEVSEKLFGLLERFTPVFEPLSLEEAYLDLSGFRLLYGHPLQTAEKIHEEIKNRLGLNSSIGIASGKLVAKIASSRAKPNGVLHVLPGNERGFLAPLPVCDIPGVGKKTAGELKLLGARTVGHLAALGEKILGSALGKFGSWLYRTALGEDSEPLFPPAEPKTVSRETTFPEDLLSRERLEAALSALTAKTCHALREAGKQARTVTVKLRYPDFETISRSQSLSEPTDLDRDVFEIAVKLFRKAWARRLRIRLVGVCLSNLTGKSWQPSIIGGPQTDRFKRLYASLDRIRERYGYEAIVNGQTLLFNRQLEFRIQEIKGRLLESDY